MVPAAPLDPHPVEELPEAPARIAGDDITQRGDHGGVPLSPDEKRILLGTSIYDLTRDTLTSLPGNSRRSPIWHPDGLRLTGARDEAERELLWMPTDGSGASEPLPTAERGIAMSWSPDGKTLAYLKNATGSTGNTANARWTSGSSEIWLLSLSGGNAPAVARRLVPGPVQSGRAQFSPDGRYLAYELQQSDRTEVFVQPVSGAGGRVRATAAPWPRGPVTDVNCSTGSRDGMA